MAFLRRFTRKKVIDREETSTELHRVLSGIDLTLLGIGSTLGVGIYVLAGEEAKKDAGPAVVVSFFVAAVASVLAGLCYAEFGARVPKAGSAYVYSYVCVGELIAFIVGWNLIMEYVIGVASVAKGYSENVDKLFDHAMSDAFRQYFHIGIFSFLSDYFDWFAFFITLALTLVLAFGVKESSLFNNVFTGLNLVVVVFVVIAGSFYADTNNWFLDKNETMRKYPNISEKAIGEGGFAPFGFNGIMKGAATCFYGFVGFDAIATTGEEAKNPQKAIPTAIIFSLIFIFLAYFGISAVITMMVPYFLQDENAPLPHAFSAAGFETGKWIVSIGAIFGLSTSLLGAMFPMPRVIYAMASDGVLFKFLSKVHPRYQTPLIATLIAGTFGGIMAAIFNLDDLINMMSIGTLTAYTLVAVCVLCLRYRKDVDGADDSLNVDLEKEYSMQAFWKRWLNVSCTPIPTEGSSAYTDKAVTVFCVLAMVFNGIAIQFEDHIANLNIAAIVAFSVCGLLLFFILVSLSLQPVSRVKLSFKVPLVPYLPGISIIANIYLVLKLSWETWIRFAVWMAIGFVIYGWCVLSGTTDKAYKAALEKRKERKYSKVSANGFKNAVFQLQEGDQGGAGGGASGIPMQNMQNYPGTSSGAYAHQGQQGTIDNDYPTSLTNRFSTFLMNGTTNSDTSMQSSSGHGYLDDDEGDHVDKKVNCVCYYDDADDSGKSQEEDDSRKRGEGLQHDHPNHKIHCPHHCKSSNCNNDTDNNSDTSTTSTRSIVEEGEKGEEGEESQQEQGQVDKVAQKLVDSVIDVAHTHILSTSHTSEDDKNKNKDE